MKKFFVIAAMVMSFAAAANAEVVSKMYGTWKAIVDHGTETVTVVISPKGMTITKSETGGETKTKYFTYKYNEKSNKIKARQYKEVETENGVTNEKHERDSETYFVKWIDANHIQLGDHPWEMDSDFGTLVRQ